MDGIKTDGKTTDGIMMATARWDGRVMVMTKGLVLGDVICPTAVRLTGGEETSPYITVTFVRRMTASAGLGLLMAVVVRGRSVILEGSATQQEKIANVVTAFNEGPSMCYLFLKFGAEGLLRWFPFY